MIKKRELLAGLALLPLAKPALAQEYPSRPIRLLVGFAAGGSTDVFARAIAPRLQALLGQPVVIENRPGAGGNIATEATTRSAPDGYTLLLGTIGPLAINPTLYGNLSFDPLKDLTPVSLIGEVPNVLAVPVDRPFRSVADIIAAAKARPETLNFGSSGIGSAGHLAAEQLNLMAGIRTTHVPYRGGGALLPELIAGRVDYAFTTALNGIPQAEAGKLRILGVPNGKRVPLLPEIPTIAESGYPGFKTITWNGIVAPTGTPLAIINKLSNAIQEIVATPDMQTRLLQIGVDHLGNTSTQFKQTLANDIKTWADAAKASNLKVE
jgi:tripartite-type tricarboxylate transporter receptor subunit TctC